MDSKNPQVRFTGIICVPPPTKNYKIIAFTTAHVQYPNFNRDANNVIIITTTSTTSTITTTKTSLVRYTGEHSYRLEQQESFLPEVLPLPEDEEAM